MGKPDVIHISNAPCLWLKNPDYVYIGRPGQGLRGTLGNPIQLGFECPVCHRHHNDRGSTLICYEVWLRNRIASNADFCRQVKELWGKTLVCFCHPRPCHGHILAKVCEELNAGIAA